MRLLPGRDLVIGRGSHVEVRIDDPSVSREHCRLRWDRERMWLAEDLTSAHVERDVIDRSEASERACQIFCVDDGLVCNAPVATVIDHAALGVAPVVPMRAMNVSSIVAGMRASATSSKPCPRR